MSYHELDSPITGGKPPTHKDQRQHLNQPMSYVMQDRIELDGIRRFIIAGTGETVNGRTDNQVLLDLAGYKLKDGGDSQNPDDYDFVPYSPSAILPYRKRKDLSNLTYDENVYLTERRPASKSMIEMRLKENGFTQQGETKVHRTTIFDRTIYSLSRLIHPNRF